MEYSFFCVDFMLRMKGRMVVQVVKRQVVESVPRRAVFTNFFHGRDWDRAETCRTFTIFFAFSFLFFGLEIENLFLLLWFEYFAN